HLLFGRHRRGICLQLALCLYSRPAVAIYPLSLHDALPISTVLYKIFSNGQKTAGMGGITGRPWIRHHQCADADARRRGGAQVLPDRKSTRLNSSHVSISYAVFCLKKTSERALVRASSRGRH